MNATREGEAATARTGCFTGGQLRQLELERYRPPRTLLTACGDDEDANDSRRVTELPECGVMLMMRGTTRAHFDDDGAVGAGPPAARCRRCRRPPRTTSVIQQQFTHALAMMGRGAALRGVYSDCTPSISRCSANARFTVAYASQ